VLCLINVFWDDYKRVSNDISACNYPLHELTHIIRPAHKKETAMIAVVSLVSRLDCCNSLPASRSRINLNRLMIYKTVC